MAVDNRPIASGLITQEVVAGVKVGSHNETLVLNVVSVGYPVILGLDWLRRHNPRIDWKANSLSLECCGLSRASPSTVFAKGYGLSTHMSLNTTCVGLGFGLTTSPFTSFHSLVSADRSISQPEEATTTTDLDNTPTPTPSDSRARTSFLAAFIHHNGFGNSLRRSPFTPPPDVIQEPKPFEPPDSPDVKILGSRKFLKQSKDSPISYLRYFHSSSPHYIRSFTTDSTTAEEEVPQTNDSDDVEDLSEFIPETYRPWADSVFNPKEFEKLPEHRPFDIEIELEDGKTPPFSRMYRLTQQERDAVAEYVHSNLRRGHIRPSTSSAGAPVLFTRKKTGEIRLCVDFRGLNAITRKNRFPLPLIDDLLDRVQGCKIFSVIDLKSAYSHLRVREGDEWKTAFRTHLGLFEHLIVPYGLTNAPSAWQAFIQDVLSDLIDVICVVYLDDILIFSRTLDEHRKHVALVLDRLRDASLCANPKKCEFEKDEVEFLGYIVSASGIKMNPKKLSTIAEWPEPTKVRHLQSFLGFTNFYRRFIDGYSRIVHPLVVLTRKNAEWSWNDDTRAAFQSLKNAFTKAPVLTHFNPLSPSTLATDASDFAISGVLQQPDEQGHLHPVAYYSRKLSPSEVNYDVHDKELLAVVECFREMRAWLLGSTSPISVVCDHRNLEYFMHSQVLNRRQARWAMFLSEFDFRLDWAAGSSNVADASSRRPDYFPEQGDERLEIQRRVLLTPLHTERLFSSNPTITTPTTVTASALVTLTLDNSDMLQRFLTAFQEDIEWRRALANGNSDFTVQNDLVFHNGRLYVPQPLRRSILEARHDRVLAGHPGRTRTLNLVSRDYSWPGMSTYVRRYVAACDNCPRSKDPRHKPFGLLQPLEIPSRPWQAITMDFIVKLPTSHGYDSIWVVCDRLTRAAHFIPCRESMTAQDLAWLFLDRIFRLHGLPLSIVSDRGSLFVSNFWRSLLSHLGVEAKHSTAYHAQTDGLTERTNQTLEVYLRSYVSYQQDDWVDYLPLAEFAFNNSENASTKQSPFFANLGYHPIFEPVITERSTNPAADDLAKRLQQIHTELRAELQHAQETQARYYNQRHLPHPKYKEGQLVWLLRRNIRTTRPSDKLDHRRLGPFPIKRAVGQRAFELQLPSYLSRLHPVFNVSLLEPYNDPSEFHTHSDPVPLSLDDNSPSIHSFIDCRKIGQRYEYLVHWKDLPDDENSWVPLSDIPTSCNELIDRFHRRHPKAPRPHEVILSRHFNPLPDEPPYIPIPELTDENSSTENSRPHDRALRPSVPSADPRPPSPPAVRQPNLRKEYVPPAKTTLGTGRVSKPPNRLDL